jgi:hypothetical protein
MAANQTRADDVRGSCPPTSIQLTEGHLLTVPQVPLTNTSRAPEWRKEYL